MRFVPVAARLSFAVTLATIALILGSALARTAHLLSYPASHAIYGYGVAIGIAALVLGVVWWIARLVSEDTAAARFGYIGLIGALAIMFVPLNTMRLAFIEPPLNDITTDSETPPPFKAVLPLRAGAENPPDYDGKRQVTYDGEEMSAIEAQKQAYPDVKAVKLITPVMVLYWRAFEAAKKMGWNVVAFDKDARTVEAVDTDFLTGATSDIAIRVRPSGMGARLDIRSKSRMGQTDAGANAAIIKDYFAELTGN